MLSYGYDSRDEMTAEQSAQSGNGMGGSSVYSDAFGYDLSYNPTSFKGTTVTENIDNQFTLSGYAYDGNGNPTTYSGNNLTFDVENRLVGITSPAFAAAYAPDDHRARKTAAGQTTYYLYDEDGGASPLLEETYNGGNGTTSVTMGYGMAADGLRARYAPQSGGLYYLFQYDPQGSLVQRQTGGPGGNTTYYALDTAQYDGYGSKLSDTDAFTGGPEPPRDAMGFQGQFGAYTDTETGLVLMGHRYYSPGTGRFLTRDPLGYGGGINLYGFVGNNPVNEMDPSGLRPLDSQDLARFARLRSAGASSNRDLAGTGVSVAIIGAVNQIKAAIAAVPVGKTDPASLKAIFFAIDSLGNSAYGENGTINNGHTAILGSGTNKCNIFVANAYAEGASVGFGRSGIPLYGKYWNRHTAGANELGNRSADVPNFPVISTRYPEVGDIAAFMKPDPRYSGHSTLYLGNDVLIYAGGMGVKLGILSINQMGHEPVVFRRYAPGH